MLPLLDVAAACEVRSGDTRLKGHVVCMGRPVSGGGTELRVANDVLPAIDANVSASGTIVSKQCALWSGR